MEKIIRRLLKKYRTNCPFRLAAHLNIEVWFEDLGSSTRGMYRKTLRRKYIAIHSGLSKEWQRFICAHELAHAILHPGVSRFWMEQNTFFCVGKYERQASQFAILLLTQMDKPQEGESLQDFLRGKDIPYELHIFY